jgi:hypothetical protein
MSPAAHPFCASVLRIDQLEKVHPTFSSVSNFNMASARGVMLTHARGFGGKCWSKKGVFEPKRVQTFMGEEHRRIYLKDKIFDTWQEAKISAGYEHSNDTNFAAQMHICCHWNFAAGRFTI